jgi:hypothetical protein
VTLDQVVALGAKGIALVIDPEATRVELQRRGPPVQPVGSAPAAGDGFGAL